LSKTFTWADYRYIHDQMSKMVHYKGALKKAVGVCL